MAIAIASPSRWPPPIASRAMTTTPASAAMLAIRVRRDGRSPIHAQARAAVMKGRVA